MATDTIMPPVHPGEAWNGDKIGPTPTIALILIALLLIAARSASLALEATTPEVKRRSSRKEVRMNRQLILWFRVGNSVGGRDGRDCGCCHPSPEPTNIETN